MSGEDGSYNETFRIFSTKICVESEAAVGALSPKSV